MYGFLLLSLCLANACIHADLFDLYKVYNLYSNLPGHIQQTIIKDCIGKPSCYICLGTICKSNERIVKVAYNDYTTISILTYSETLEPKTKLRTYRLHPFESCYRLSQVKPSISCRFMPVIPKAPFNSIKERFSDAQPIIALPKSFIDSLVPAQKHKRTFIEGLFLRQHNKAQWHTYEYVCNFNDTLTGLSEIAWIPLNTINHCMYSATALNNNVFIYKRNDTFLEHEYSLPHSVSVCAAAFSPDNTTLLTACVDNTLHIWSLPIIPIKTIEQLLFIKLITTAQQFETFWSFENLAQRLCISLSQNLSQHTTDSVINYLTALLSSLDQQSQKILMSTYLSSVHKVPKKQPYLCTLQ